MNEDIMQQSDLRAVERGAWRFHFADGLIEIVLGLMLAGMGTAALLERLGFSEAIAATAMIVIYATAYFIFFVLKRAVSRPRAGLVRYGSKRRAKLRTAILVSFVVLTIGAVLGLLTAFAAPPVQHWGALGGWLLVCLGLGWLAAYLFDYPRFVVLGALCGLSMPVGKVLELAAGISYALPTAFCAAAVIVTLMGAVRLSEFVRAHPLAPQDDGNA